MKKKLRKNMTIVLTLIILAVVGVIGTQALQPQDLSTQYDTVIVGTTDIGVNVSADGKVASLEKEIVNLDMTQTLIESFVNVGDSVNKNDELCEYTTMTGDAEALLATIDGIVTSVPGTSIYGSSSSYVISNPDDVGVDIQVGEKYINKIKEGQDVEIYIEAIDKTINGTVTWVSYAGITNQDYTVYDVAVTIDNDEDILLGMSAGVKIITDKKTDVVAVPLEGIFEKYDVKYVLLESYLNAEKSEAIEDYYREVTVGVTDGEYIEIVSGLNSGDKILIEKESSQAQFSAFPGRPGSVGGDE